ncbi:MAG: xanthine dehydrogenase family protein molybdopterin-binding subunit [Spirochaetaceae bacterium]|nr:xanthine dehydrogenase family protein molybdopterin-binding subunit [Spirochaetaceae bacterium]
MYDAVKKSRKRSRYSNPVELANISYSDINLPDMLYSVLIRSPVQCGKILSVDFSEPLPENIFFFTGKDIPQEKTITVNNIKIPIFADEEVSYLGQPIGILVGPDEEELVNISQEICIGADFDFPEEFSETFSDKQILAHKTITFGEPDKYFMDSQNAVENTFFSKINSINEESNGVIVHYSNKKLNIYTNTRWISYMRETLSKVNGINGNDIIIRKTNVVKSNLNDIWINTLTTAQVTVAALKLKKPVKLVYTPDEQEQYIRRENPAIIRNRTAIDENNNITAMDISILVDAGAFNPFIQYVLEKFVITASGVYRIPNIKISAFALRTNYTPLNPSFSWGDSQAFFAVENQINRIISEFQRDFLDFRYKNLLSDEKSDFYISHENISIKNVIDSIIKKSDFLRRNTSYSLIKTDNSDISTYHALRGIGLAAAYEGNGFLFPDVIRSKYSLELTLETDGTLTVKKYIPSKTLKNIWLKIIKENLDLSENQVKFDIESCIQESDEPDVLENNISILTQLLKKCCTTLQHSRFRQALPITVKKTYKLMQKSLWDNEKFTGQPFHSTTWGAAAAEIEISLVTYKAELRNLYVVLDCGEVLDEKSAANSLKVSICQLISSFSDIISSNNINPEIYFLPSSDNPKGIGEIINHIIPAAITSAISQAAGKPLTSIPLEPDTIFNMVTNKKEAKPQ